MGTLFEVMERFADGRATAGELEAAYFEIWGGEIAPDPYRWRDAYRVAETAWNFAADREAEASGQDNLLRCLLGPLPFRPVPLDAAWLTPDVLGIAQSLYEGGSFPDLPVLADALEEAGCHDSDILGHLRSPGPHARGCWVVDLLLAKA